MGIREEIRLVKRGDGVRPEVLQRWRVELDALVNEYDGKILDLTDRLSQAEVELEQATRPKAGR